MAALLASIANFYKIVWVLCQSQAGLGMLKVVAVAPCIGEPDLPVHGTPDIFISQSPTYALLTLLLCHTLSFPAVLLATMFKFLPCVLNELVKPRGRVPIMIEHLIIFSLSPVVSSIHHYCHCKDPCQYNFS